MSDKPTKSYFRQRHQNRLYDAVLQAIEESAVRDKVRRKDIAATLDIPPSQVTRLLSVPANWTVDTVSDLLFAVGAELDVRVVALRDRAPENRFHPAGEAPLSVASVQAGMETASCPGAGAPPSSGAKPSKSATPNVAAPKVTAPKVTASKRQRASSRPSGRHPARLP